MSERLNLREETRKAYTSTTETNSFNLEQLRTGALLRIADATEKMAASYDQLRRERDNLSASVDAAWEREARLERRVAALRGVITRMKKEAAQ